VFRYIACLAAAELVAQILPPHRPRKSHHRRANILLMVLWVAAYWDSLLRFLAIIAPSPQLLFSSSIGNFTVGGPAKLGGPSSLFS